MTSKTPLTVLLADDHPTFLRGLRGLIADYPEFVIVDAVSDGEAALEIIRETKPAIAVLDIAMPKMSGIDVLNALASRNSATRVVLLTASLSDEHLFQAVAANAYGVVLKSSGDKDLIGSLRRVGSGEKVIPNDLLEAAVVRAARRKSRARFFEHLLTAREAEISNLTIRGMSNKAIARELGVAEGTVKLHLYNIFQKLGVSNRTELAALAHRAKEQLES
jgi:DNA-binding NarL/FixJ family response regulator